MNPLRPMGAGWDCRGTDDMKNPRGYDHPGARFSHLRRHGSRWRRPQLNPPRGRAQAPSPTKGRNGRSGGSRTGVRAAKAWSHSSAARHRANMLSVMAPSSPSRTDLARARDGTFSGDAPMKTKGERKAPVCPHCGAKTRRLKYAGYTKRHMEHEPSCVLAQSQEGWKIEGCPAELVSHFHGRRH
jgi:hypothetical protein